MTVEKDDVGLAISLQVRASHNTKNVFAYLEDTAHKTMLLELHDLMVLEDCCVMR